MPSVNTHFIEVKLSPENGGPSNIYTQLDTPRDKLSFDIDTKYNITVQFYDDKAHTMKFNAVSVYQYKLDNIQELKARNQRLAFVYDAVSDFPVKVVVKFLRYSDYEKVVKNINEAKVKAEREFL
tara:strand:+ start:1063 stop:1437 length:375 start_codon:yes stop_codon:yes gene_type:complete